MSFVKGQKATLNSRENLQTSKLPRNKQNARREEET